MKSHKAATHETSPILIKFEQEIGTMPLYLVRYGAMRLLGVFKPRGDNTYNRGDKVIVRTNRGLEVGTVLCRAKDYHVKQLGQEWRGTVLRRMSKEDENELKKIHEQEKREFQICQRFIDQLGLEMHLVDVEHIFGGERIIVYYLANGRVDFRKLVKMLAAEFQTRIEMRQIGVRDEAKLLADYGDCGKPVCCNTHLVTMPPVSMKMAKLQKATLDPSKISGRCGRLKCCLRFEYETYEELQRQLPPVGSIVQTATGTGKVVGHEILAQQVWVETEDDHVRKLLPVEEVTVIASGKDGTVERSSNSAGSEQPTEDEEASPEHVSSQENATEQETA